MVNKSDVMAWWTNQRKFKKKIIIRTRNVLELFSHSLQCFIPQNYSHYQDKSDDGCGSTRVRQKCFTKDRKWGKFNFSSRSFLPLELYSLCTELSDHLCQLLCCWGLLVPCWDNQSSGGSTSQPETAVSGRNQTSAWDMHCSLQALSDKCVRLHSVWKHQKRVRILFFPAIH